MAMARRTTPRVAPLKKRGRPVLDASVSLSEKIALRASLEDKEQLDAIVSGSGLKDSLITRAALRLGLSLLEAEPHLFTDAMRSSRQQRGELMRQMLAQRSAGLLTESTKPPKKS